ncbi:hypothetical protein BGW41_002677 [Actinomortierella wolfii]|nr:hypothetical protein BGW41_002677 [Actinomortierella wolfii]
MIYPDVGPSKISLIGIIASCTTYLTGFLSGSLSDRYGYRQTASIGALIMTVSLVLASFSTQLWHLYVTQGLMMGFGASLAYYAAVGAPAHWFTSRRGIAMGISSAGAGVGGFYLAPLTQFLVTKTGLPWTLRALALYCLCACGIASLLLAEYKQPQITSKQKGQIATCKDEGLAASRTSMAFKLLPIVRKPIFQVLVASQFLLAMAYLTPAYYLEVYATHIGLSEQMGASIIGWFNGATVVSRVVTGIVADRISKGGLLIVSSWMTCISVLVIWPLATSPGPFIAYALIYGVSFGAVTTVVPVMMVDYYDELLFEACRSDNLDLLEEVLSNDPSAFDINYTDGVGNSALHIAARNGSAGVLEVLLYYDGINPNIANRLEGDTPLHKAAAYPDHELAHLMVQTLINGGANPKIQNKLKQRPVDVAPADTHADVRVLLEHAILGAMVNPSDVVAEDDSEDSDPPSDEE